jgi:hypothetical protein
VVAVIREAALVVSASCYRLVIMLELEGREEEWPARRPILLCSNQDCLNDVLRITPGCIPTNALRQLSPLFQPMPF